MQTSHTGAQGANHLPKVNTVDQLVRTSLQKVEKEGSKAENVFECLAWVNRLSNGALDHFDWPLFKVEEAGLQDVKEESLGAFTLDHLVRVRPDYLGSSCSSGLAREQELDSHEKV